jgi:hypothetical protein
VSAMSINQNQCGNCRTNWFGLEFAHSFRWTIFGYATLVGQISNDTTTHVGSKHTSKMLGMLYHSQLTKQNVIQNIVLIIYVGSHPGIVVSTTWAGMC